uniref:Uncharacterized protein n=1 Tax=Peronospora matthiolae TaxID=2874970 RepID=A0AAV1VMA3_9STRA
MRTGAFLYALLLAALAPAASPQECGKDTLGHDEVKAFKQPSPVTEAERVALRFNPTILVGEGCMPYPAVNYRGQVSEGLKPSGRQNGKCKGSGHGSQVYGRATEFDGKYALMYAYYSPKKMVERSRNDRASPEQGYDHRHAWDHCVVWLPSRNSSTILAVSGVINSAVFIKPSEMDGDRIKLAFEETKGWDIYLQITSKEGGHTLPLIMWEQMTEAARCSLSETDWGVRAGVMPLGNRVFQDQLARDNPFKKDK